MVNTKPLKEVKLIIAGSRDFNDYKLLCDSVEKIIQKDYPNHKLSIVSGMAKGADSLGYLYAESKGLNIHKFPADWNKHGMAAGPIRNKEMGDFADALLAFWDGQSKGTKHMINYINSLGKPGYVVFY